MTHTNIISRIFHTLFEEWETSTIIILMIANVLSLILLGTMLYFAIVDMSVSCWLIAGIAVMVCGIFVYRTDRSFWIQIKDEVLNP